MADPIPIVYNTAEIGKRLKELERERLASLRRADPLVLPRGMMILLNDDRATRVFSNNVIAAFVFSEPKALMTLIHARDGRTAAMESVIKMIEYLRSEFPSIKAIDGTHINMSVGDAYRLAERLRASASEQSSITR